MQDFSKEFDTLFKKQGGLSDDNQILLKKGSNIMDAILNLSNRDIDVLIRGNSKLPKPYVNFIDNFSINAVAAKYNNQYFIGINTGTLFLVNQLFIRMLSSPNILKQWGVPSVEEPTRKLFNAQITDIETYYLSAESNFAMLPKDPTRRHLINLLTINAMRFLTMHEYGHIAMGHLDFINSLDKGECYFEFDGTSKVDSMVSQTLEIDADCFGFNRGIRDIEKQIANSEYTINDFRPFYKDFESSLALYVFSIYSFFRLFGMQKPDLNKLESLSHPPSGFRQNIFVSLIATLYQSKGEVYNAMIANLVVKVTNEVENAFDEISYQGLDASSFLSSFETVGVNHITKIRENWNNVRPLLEPYAFAKLAPLQD